MQNRPSLLLLHAVKRFTASSHREEEAWRFTSDVVWLMSQCGSSNRLNQWSQKDGKIIEIQGLVKVWMFKYFPLQLKGAIVSLSSSCGPRFTWMTTAPPGGLFESFLTLGLGANKWEKKKHHVNENINRHYHAFIKKISLTIWVFLFIKCLEHFNGFFRSVACDAL